MDIITTESAANAPLRSILLKLARHQDELAVREAEMTPYWEPTPTTVLGHRSAAAALRAEAQHLLAS